MDSQKWRTPCDQQRGSGARSRTPCEHPVCNFLPCVAREPFRTIAYRTGRPGYPMYCRLSHLPEQFCWCDFSPCKQIDWLTVSVLHRFFWSVSLEHCGLARPMSAMEHISQLMQSCPSADAKDTWPGLSEKHDRQRCATCRWTILSVSVSQQFSPHIDISISCLEDNWGWYW